MTPTQQESNNCLGEGHKSNNKNNNNSWFNNNNKGNNNVNDNNCNKKTLTILSQIIIRNPKAEKKCPLYN